VRYAKEIVVYLAVQVHCKTSQIQLDQVGSCHGGNKDIPVPDKL